MHPNRYDKIQTLPHHVSASRRQMSQRERAAQFSPFAALTGYEDAIAEAARLTDQPAELTEEAAQQLNRQMQILMDHIQERPSIDVTYFVPDEKKSGGSYETVSGRVRRVDRYEQMIIYADGRRIPLQMIHRIEGKIFHPEQQNEE